MFEKHITDFNDNILSLRDFVDLIEPFLIKKFKEHDRKVQPILALGLVNQLLKEEEKTPETGREKLLKHKEDIEEYLQGLFNEKVEVECEEIERKKGGFTFKNLQMKGAKDFDFSSHVEDAKKTSSHIELLYKNAFISLITSVEWFFAQILHFYYDKYPESAGIQNKTLTLNDLKTFESIKDAEKHLIEEKIEDVLRGNFESWIELLKRDLKLSLGYLDPHKDDLVEIYQRRNLLIHNGGVVNSIYFSKVKAEKRKDIKLNQKLKIGKVYLDAAIRKMHLLYILIGSELWKKLDPNDKNRGDILTDIIYENLTKSRWDIAEGLSHFVINDAKMNVTDKVVGQLNNWLCKKRLGKFNEVKNDVEKADFSDKKEIFQLGLLALQENKEKFFELLPYALDSRQLNIERLEEFPIFEEMRKTEEYSKFKLESKYFSEPNQPIIDEEKNTE